MLVRALAWELVLAWVQELVQESAQASVLVSVSELVRASVRELAQESAWPLVPELVSE